MYKSCSRTANRSVLPSLVTPVMKVPEPAMREGGQNQVGHQNCKKTEKECEAKK